MADDGRTLARALAKVRADLRALAAVVGRHTTHIADIAAVLPVVGAQSERFGQVIDPLPVGLTTVPVTWPTPFPDTVYMVVPVLSVPTANMGTVFVSAGQKTVTGCTVVVRNTGAASIIVVLDVLGIRT